MLVEVYLEQTGAYFQIAKSVMETVFDVVTF